LGWEESIVVQARKRLVPEYASHEAIKRNEISLAISEDIPKVTAAIPIDIYSFIWESIWAIFIYQ